MKIRQEMLQCTILCWMYGIRTQFNFTEGPTWECRACRIREAGLEYYWSTQRAYCNKELELETVPEGLVNKRLKHHSYNMQFIHQA